MSDKIITMEDFNNILDVLNKIYDSVRIIKPLKKKIMDFSKGVLCETQCNCYDFWLQEKICSNCISMRAFNEKDTFFKLSWVDNKIYTVIAIPVLDSDETIILELVKDVTNSMTVDFPKVIENNSLLQTLNEIGQLQIKDSLTGIYNRRFIDERLPVDILNNSVDLIPFTIIFADIDRFKLVNDTYGHVAGDYILKEFAALLKKSIVGKDEWVARYGGEEFLMYLKNWSVPSVKDFTEKIRKEVEDSEFNHEGNIIRITASFGVCSLFKNWNIKAEELIEIVDKNMYAAKSGGRNKIITSEL